MNFIDYYKVLEVDKSASQDDIKKAFKRLARKYHPDLNPNDPDAKRKFQEINEANEVLSDPEKRKKYDQYGENWEHAAEFEKGQQGGQQGYDFGQGQNGSTFWSYSTGDNGDENMFSDFFEQLFGGMNGSSRHRTQSNYGFRGQDYSANITVPLEEAAVSHSDIISVKGKKLRMTIPAGIADGQKIRLVGQGGVGVNGGPAGDLYITFNVPDSAKFHRSGDDLYETINIKLSTAILGGEQIVDTLNGQVKLKIKPCMQNNSKVRLKGQGFPIYKNEGKHGDLIVTFSVLIPEKITEDQKTIFESLKKSNL